MSGCARARSLRRPKDSGDRAAWAARHPGHVASCPDCRVALDLEERLDLLLSGALSPAAPDPGPGQMARWAAAAAAVTLPAPGPSAQAPPAALWLLPAASIGACLTAVWALGHVPFLPWAVLPTAATPGLAALAATTSAIGPAILLAASAAGAAVDILWLRHPALKEVIR